MINLIKQAVYYVFGKPNYGYQEVLKTEIKEKNEKDILIEKYKNFNFIYESSFFEHPIFLDLFYKKLMSYDYKKENKKRKDVFLESIKKPSVISLAFFALFILSLLALPKIFAIFTFLSFVSTAFYVMYLFVEKGYLLIEDLDDVIQEIKLDQNDYNYLSSYFNKTSIENLQHYNLKKYRWCSYYFIDILSRQYKINGEKSLYISDSIHHNDPEFKEFVLEKKQTNELY